MYNPRILEDIRKTTKNLRISGLQGKNRTSNPPALIMFYVRNLKICRPQNSTESRGILFLASL
jgi:hypothetical protein